MRLLDKYIFKEFISLVAGVLLGILVVYVCVEFLQKADRLIKFHATFGQILKYFLFSIPSMISISLPMATLIAALLSVGTLSRHNEIIAMRAGGVSLSKIVAPLIAGGLLISAFAFLNNEVIMPAYSSRAIYIKNVEIEKKQQSVMFQRRKLWLRGPENSIVNIGLISPNRREMLGLNIFKLNPDYSVKERIKAGGLVWKDGSWRLKDSRTYFMDGGAMRSRSSDNEVFNLVGNPDDLGMIVKDSDEMSYSEMRDYVRRLKESGYKALSYEVDLQSKLAFPLSSLLMVLISIPFSVHKVRGGGSAKGFAIAILIAFFYWTLASIGSSLGHSGVIPPVAAAWFANVFFAVAACMVLFRMQRTM
jgi:lipopolysaccharide export system permease protein